MPKQQRRPTPGEAVPELSPAEQARYDLIDAAEEFKGKPAFLDYIDGLTQAECECREVWIYRLNADGTKERSPGRTKAYLEICAVPLDSDGVPCLRQYVAEKYGGGRYEIFLKIRVPGQRQKIDDHHTATFDVGGAPKIPAPQPTPTPGISGQPASAAAPSGNDALALEVFRASQLQNPIKDARETLNLVKELGDTMKPAPATDQISQLTALAGLLKSLTPAPPVAATVASAPDPFDTYLKVRGVVKEMVLEAAPPPSPLPGRTSELVELLKAGGPAAIDLAKTIYGQPAEPGGFGTAAGEALATLIKDRPQAIGQAWDLLTHGLSSMMSRLVVPVTVRADAQLEQATQPSISPTPGTAGTAVEPSSAAQVESRPSAPGMPPQAVIDDIFGIVVRNFKIGLDGTTVGIIILGAFPKMQPFLQMVCSQPLDAVLPELRKQSAIAPIVDDPRFAEFFGRFAEMCMNGLPTAEDMIDGEEDETPAAAAVANGQ